MARQAPQTAALNSASISEIESLIQEENPIAMRQATPGSKSLVSIESLPNELLNHIFEYLDTPPPSASTSRLHDEPTIEITRSDATTLKAISSVSKKWRAVVLPVLFKNAQFIAPPFWHRDSNAAEIVRPFVYFLKQTSLSSYVTSFTIAVPYVEPLPETDARSIVKDLETIWMDIFSVIDPLDVLIVAPPEALGLLTACSVDTYDSDTYDAPYHYLKLHRQPDITTDAASSSLKKSIDTPNGITPAAGSVSTGGISRTPDILDAQRQSILFNLRPWNSLMLNEGSFVRGYGNGFSSPAPSILNDLFGCFHINFEEDEHDGAARNGRGALINPSIRELAYVAIFPPEFHFANFVQFLPPVDSIFIQFVPRNDILNDEKRMEFVDSDELWHQRNSCYATIMRELFNHHPSENYAQLREFESGDAADRDAWHMAVEFVKRTGAGVGWSVERDGVFIRTSRSESGGQSAQSALSALSVAD